MQELRFLKPSSTPGSAGRATGSDSSAVLSAPRLTGSARRAGPRKAHHRQTSRRPVGRVTPCAPPSRAEDCPPSTTLTFRELETFARAGLPGFFALLHARIPASNPSAFSVPRKLPST
jgi:hypothetical protein